MKKLNRFCCALIIFFLSVTFAYAEQTVIRILYVNDFHGFAEPYKPLGSDKMLGGIAYLCRSE